MMRAEQDTPPSPRLLHLLPIALQGNDLAILDWLGSALTESIGVICVRDASIALDECWLEPDRNRYSSNRVIDGLLDSGAVDHHTDPHEWTLAFTDEDLIAPGREFVIGEAAFGGFLALISLARLRAPEMSDDTDIVRERVLCEALHELGHLAAIEHCDSLLCVMSEAYDTHDIDRRASEFCDRCDARLRIALDRRPRAG